MKRVRQRLIRPRFLLVLQLSVIITLLAAACSSDDTPTPITVTPITVIVTATPGPTATPVIIAGTPVVVTATPGPSPTPIRVVVTATPLPAATPTSVPKQSGTLKVATERIRDEGRFLVKNGIRASAMLWHDFMLWRDAPGVPQPGIVEEWTVSGDGQDLTLKMREGVKFHDGHEATAEDIVWGLKTNIIDDSLSSWKQPFLDWLGLESYTSMADDIPSVTVVDDYTIEVDGQASFALLLNVLTPMMGSVGFVVPKHLWEGTKAGELGAKPEDIDLTKHTIGAGPWKYIDWEPAQFLRYEAVAPDWDGLSPHRSIPEFDELRITAVPDAATRSALLQTEGVDIATLPEISAFELRDRGSILFTVPDQRIVALYAYMLNAGTDNPDVPTSFASVRQALFEAINIDELLVLTGNVGQLTPPYPCIQGGTGCAGFDLHDYDFNPTHAKQLLQDAGFADGFDITVYYSVRPGTEYSLDIAQALPSYFQAIGVKATMIERDFSPIRTMDQEDDPALTGALWLFPRTARPLTQLNVIFMPHSTRGLRVGVWPDLDAKLEACENEVSPTKLDAACREAVIAIRDKSFVYNMFSMPLFLVANPGTVADIENIFASDEELAPVWESVKRVK